MRCCDFYSLHAMIRGLVSKETAVLRRWGVKRMFGLSTDFITKGNLATVKEILTLVKSVLESLYGGQFTFSYQLC